MIKNSINDDVKDDRASFPTSKTAQTSLSAIKRCKTRAVKFATDVQVRVIPHLGEMTEAERKQCWYDEEEMLLVRKEARNAIMMVREERSMFPPVSRSSMASRKIMLELEMTGRFNMSFRGLEQYESDAHETQRQHKIQSVVSNVLEEQEKQRSARCGINSISNTGNDTRKICMVSALLSTSSQVGALLMASSDAAMVVTTMADLDLVDRQSGLSQLTPVRLEMLNRRSALKATKCVMETRNVIHKRRAKSPTSSKNGFPIAPDGNVFLLQHNR